MSDAWLVVLVVGVVTVTLKAAGPVLMHGRTLPVSFAGVLDLLAPALLSALIVVQIFGAPQQFVIDARAAGLATGAAALLLRAPVLVAMALAAAVTGLLRHLS